MTTTKNTRQTSGPCSSPCYQKTFPKSASPRKSTDLCDLQHTRVHSNVLIQTTQTTRLSYKQITLYMCLYVKPVFSKGLCLILNVFYITCNSVFYAVLCFRTLAVILASDLKIKKSSDVTLVIIMRAKADEHGRVAGHLKHSRGCTESRHQDRTWGGGDLEVEGL